MNRETLTCTKERIVFFISHSLSLFHSHSLSLSLSLFLSLSPVFIPCLCLDSAKISVEAEDTDDEGAPQISLQEMLEDLHIGGDATGGEGAPMME